MTITPREMIKELKNNGFVEIQSNGSHRFFKNFETGKTTTVPYHSKELPKGLEKRLESRQECSSIPVYFLKINLREREERTMEKILYPKTLHFPALVHKEKHNSFWVEFPDVPAALSDGETIEEVIANAQLALGITLEYMEGNNEKLPAPTDMFELEKTLDENSFATLINFDYLNYKIKNGSKSVKKTVTIPEYLNTLGIENNVNFSQLLQKALKEELSL